MSSIYILGGRRDLARHGTHRGFVFEKALIAELDVETGEVDICVEYESPRDVCPREHSIVFKAAFLDGDVLYTCTETEVVIYRVPSFEQISYLSMPCFNDVHFVRPTPEGNLLIANTGLDMVLEVTHEGGILRAWDVLGRPTWHRFSPHVDYRKVPSTKPHDSHPNYVFYVGEDIWVHRMQQRDATCLTKPNRWIPVRTKREKYGVYTCGGHDGIVYNGKIYFTTIDGHVVVADSQTCKIEKDYDLNRGVRSLGWCRGLHVVDETHAIVGFSRLRPTKHAENLAWVTGGVNYFKRTFLTPTRIALYDLSRGRARWQKNLETVGMDAVFSIHVFDAKSPRGGSQTDVNRELVGT